MRRMPLLAASLTAVAFLSVSLAPAQANTCTTRAICGDTGGSTPPLPTHMALSANATTVKVNAVLNFTEDGSAVPKSATLQASIGGKWVTVSTVPSPTSKKFVFAVKAASTAGKRDYRSVAVFKDHTETSNTVTITTVK